MRVAVVVPFRGEWSGVPRLAGCICAQTRIPEEVVFVIDGGDAGDVARFRRLLEHQTRLPRCGSNVQVLQQSWAGPAAARNRGFKATSAEIVVFLEADGEYSNNYLERISEILGSEDVGSVCPELRLADVDIETWTGRYQLAKWKGIARLTRAGRRPVLGGWAFRRRVFEIANGYDERLLVGEDRDLVERIRQQGLRIVVARRTSFRHPEPSSPLTLCAKAFSRARLGLPYYRKGRPTLLVASARALGPTVILASGAISLAALRLHSILPVAIAFVGLAVSIIALFVATLFDQEVGAAARSREGMKSAMASRTWFTVLRLMERVSAFAGLVAGTWSTRTGQESPRVGPAV